MGKISIDAVKGEHCHVEQSVEKKDFSPSMAVDAYLIKLGNSPVRIGAAMTPERAQSIRSHWAAYRDDAIDFLLTAGVFLCPVKQKLPPVCLSLDPVQSAEIPIYEYKIEHGYQDDRAMTRVVCEGIEVEIGPRPQWAKSK